MTVERLAPDVLRRTGATFDFDSTAELEPLTRLVGQDRALDALDFGVAIDSPGFNIFVLGEEGSGRRTATLAALRRQAADAESPDDWCYLNNFEDPRRPRALRLPAGTGRRLASDMETFVTELASELPRVFGSEGYRAQRSTILEDLNARRRELFSEAQEEARRRGLAMIPGPQAIVLTPQREGRPLSEEEVAQLSPEERERYQSARQEVEQRFGEALEAFAEAAEAAQTRLRELNQTTAQAAAAHLLRSLRRRYRELPRVLEYLDAVERDLLKVIGRLVMQAEAEPEQLTKLAQTDEFQRRYGVNVVVDHAEDGMPVVEEPNPTFPNLLGRIEHRVLQGALTTDHMLIRAGALLRANGGFLLVDALDVLIQPMAWEALKRALKQGELRIEEPGAQLGLPSTISLEPEPIPLDVKVVLIGAPIIYYLLHALDRDFGDIFKVKADFAPTIRRTAEAEMEYARFVATRCRDEGLPHFGARAVEALVEHGAREAGDQTRLTAELGTIADVVREAGFRARAADGDVVRREHIDTAIAARIERASRLEEELHRQIEDGTLLVRTTGSAIGQANGLSVLTAGDYAFAKPIRVSATVSLGTRGVVDLEREAELSGPVHSKGVLILDGFLNRRYGGTRPLVLSATLGFEQVYESVEGDSASVAELVSLLSAIARLPLRQDIGVTGSVNQHGDVQPVGGVSEKVEGFFHACRIQGLTGTQGVVVPRRNTQHLMLRTEIVDAIDEDRFDVYAADRVDDVIELAFGRPAADVHRRVEARLDEFVDAWKALRVERGELPGAERGDDSERPGERRRAAD